MKKKGAYTGGLAINALLLALSIVFLFLASFVPAVELSLQVLASFCIAAAIVEGGLGAGALLYVAILTLALVLLPNKLALLPFFFLFGPYPCVKHLAEKIKGKVPEAALKFLFFNASMAGAWLFFKKLFLENSMLELSWWMLLIAAQAAFFLYDYVMTLAINFYKDRIHRKI